MTKKTELDDPILGIFPNADHVWLKRCVMPEMTEGGIVMPNAARKDRPMQYGLVVGIADDITEKTGIEPGYLAFFDQGESREVFITTKDGKKHSWTVLPAECIYGSMPDDAADFYGLAIETELVASDS